MLISFTSATFESTEVSKITNPSHFHALRYTGETSSWTERLSFPCWTPENPFTGHRLRMPQHQGLQSSSHRNTVFLNLCQVSTTHFSTVKCFLWKKTDISGFHFQIDYFTTELENASSLPLWETFVLQTTVVFDTNTLFYIKSKPSKDGNAVPARILQLQGSQSILHFISDVITISRSKIVKFHLSGD